jgi:AcrR family transcriptional regulator/DNA-binding Xre family transcriptional regulator
MVFTKGSGSAGAHAGASVRRVRTERGMSLRELARCLELSPASITALETGRTTMTVDRLHEIADVLDVAPAVLYGDAPAPTADVAADGAAFTNWREFDDLVMDDVLRAALSCIVRKGYHGCSIRDIAVEAGCSVSALYHYYPSKQAMLVALFELTMTDVLGRSAAARDEAPESSPAARFGRLVESLALYHSYRKELGFLGGSEMRSLDSANYARIAAKRVSLQRMVDDEVEAGVAAGVFRTDRPREAARAVVTMCVAVAQWFNPAGGERPEEIAAAYVRFAMGLVSYRRTDAPS